MTTPDAIAAVARAYHAAITEALLSGSQPHVDAAADTLRAIGVQVRDPKAVSSWLIAAACPADRACWSAVGALWTIEVAARQVRRPTLIQRIFGQGD